MIKRPAGQYRDAVTYAQEEAHRRGDRRIGTEHLALGLLRLPALAQAAGRDLGQGRAALDALDRRALATVGLDVDLGRPIPARPSTGRLWLTPAAKTAVRQGLKEAGSRSRVEPRHMLIALLRNEPPDPSADLFGKLGLDLADLRHRLAAG